MTARERLDEMTKFIKIVEGAWQLPKTKEDFDKLHKLLNAQVGNKEFAEIMYNIIGDDTLLDDLGNLYDRDPDGIGEAAKVTIKWMKKQRTDEYSNFPEIWLMYTMSQGKSNAVKDFGKEQGIEVTDLPMSEDNEEHCLRGCGAKLVSDLDHKTGICPDCWEEEDYDPKLDEVGDVAFDDYGAIPEDNDPDGMGKYDVTIQYPDKRYDDQLNVEPLSYPRAINMAKEHIEYVEEGFPKTEITSKRIDKGDSVIFQISEFNKFDNSESEIYKIIISPSDEEDIYENIKLKDIVENVLQEYPGQPKDYDIEDEYDNATKDMRRQAMFPMDDLEADQVEFDKEIAAGATMNDFMDDKISKEIDDEELGFRFD